VVLCGLEEDPVARPDLLERFPLALAVRAPGVKWTLAAPARDGGEGAAIGSM
jgi:hypothetical protein